MTLRELGASSQPHWMFRLLHDSWKPLLWTTAVAVAAFTLIAFLIPVRYEAVARLMPPDQSGSASALMGALMANGGEYRQPGQRLLGVHTRGNVVGILSSRTIEDDIINKFDLRRLYGKKNTRMRAEFFKAVLL